MHADGGKDVGIGLTQNDSHGRACGKSRDKGAVFCNAMSCANLLHHPRKDRRLTRTAALIPPTKPIPAGLRIVAPRLGGVNHDEAMLFGQTVHAGASGKILGRLRAAVQHNDDATRAFRGG